MTQEYAQIPDVTRGFRMLYRGLASEGQPRSTGHLHQAGQLRRYNKVGGKEARLDLRLGFGALVPPVQTGVLYPWWVQAGNMHGPSTSLRELYGLQNITCPLWSTSKKVVLWGSGHRRGNCPSFYPGDHSEKRKPLQNGASSCT